MCGVALLLLVLCGVCWFSPAVGDIVSSSEFSYQLTGGSAINLAAMFDGLFVAGMYTRAKEKRTRAILAHTQAK